MIINSFNSNTRTNKFNIKKEAIDKMKKAVKPDCKNKKYNNYINAKEDKKEKNKKNLAKKKLFVEEIREDINPK